MKCNGLKIKCIRAGIVVTCTLSLLSIFGGSPFSYAFTEPDILNKEQYIADGHVLKVTWFQEILTQMLNS
jgi:hypothetical protein